MYIPAWGLVVVAVLVYWFFLTRADHKDDIIRNAIDVSSVKRVQLQEEVANLRTEVNTLRTEVESLKEDVDQVSRAGGSSHNMPL